MSPEIEEQIAKHNSELNSIFNKVEERVAPWHGQHLFDLAKALLAGPLAEMFAALPGHKQEQLGDLIRRFKSNPLPWTKAHLSAPWQDIKSGMRHRSPREHVFEVLWRSTTPISDALNAVGIGPALGSTAVDEVLASMSKNIDWADEVDVWIQEAWQHVRDIHELRKKSADEASRTLKESVASRLEEVLGD